MLVFRVRVIESKAAHFSATWEWDKCAINASERSNLKVQLWKLYFSDEVLMSMCPGSALSTSVRECCQHEILNPAVPQNFNC